MCGVEWGERGARGVQSVGQPAAKCWVVRRNATRGRWVGGRGWFGWENERYSDERERKELQRAWMSERARERRWAARYVACRVDFGSIWMRVAVLASVWCVSLCVGGWVDSDGDGCGCGDGVVVLELRHGGPSLSLSLLDPLD